MDQPVFVRCRVNSLSLRFSFTCLSHELEKRTMESPAPYPHITLNNNGVPCIDDTRHRVIDIAADHIGHGYSAGQIVEQYPDLTPAQVHAALAYYFDHQEAMDAALIDRYRQTEQFRKQRKLHPKIMAALADPVA
jgi:uncharacterized protein (DUF433 family)